jgi:hypothetical protein
MECRDGVDVSTIRVFQRCSEKRNPLLQGKIQVENWGYQTGTSTVRLFGEGGGLIRSMFEGAIVGFDR